MSESDKANLTQDILGASKEEEAIEANNMAKDLSNIKEQHSVEMKKKKEEEEEPRLPVSDSPESVPFHSLGGSFAASNHEVPAVANRIVDEVEHHYKVEEGIVSGGNSGFLMSKKEAKLIKALLCIRTIALLLCLVSFAVMADDTNKGAFQASFYNYKEFQYISSVNVVGFIYSAVQIWDLLTFMFTKKHLVNHKWVRYFRFAMDQVLTYLLLSASSSAATASASASASASALAFDAGQYFFNKTLLLGDFFTMANASIAMSFLAFMAFALATLVSGYMLFKFN